MIPIDRYPIGWFQIGFSWEVRAGGVKPLKYFGEDLVAFRTKSGVLSVLEAHCHHLGAHLGYGGKVKGDCVACPYHGWEWNGDGENTRIPYQDAPISKKLRKWPVQEKHGVIFLWHDPEGGPPRANWDLPDLFKDFPGLEENESDYYPVSPETVVNKPNEAFPVQLMIENGADTMHFHYAHGTPVAPVMESFKVENNRWLATMGFRSPVSGEVKLRLHMMAPGVGVSFDVFQGMDETYRLILSATPIDEKHTHVWVSHWFRKEPGSGDALPERIIADVKEKEAVFEQDALIWRHQKFVQRPVFAAQDVECYSLLRKWSEGFYPAEAVGGAT